jgi:isoleucyl-tRNA synthetase
MRYSAGYRTNLIPGFDCHGLPTEKTASKDPCFFTKPLETCLRTSRQKMILQLGYYRLFGLCANVEKTYATAEDSYMKHVLNNLDKLREDFVVREAKKLTK